MLLLLLVVCASRSRSAVVQSEEDSELECCIAEQNAQVGQFRALEPKGDKDEETLQSVENNEKIPKHIALVDHRGNEADEPGEAHYGYQTAVESVVFD